ncbi:MAG TPA: NAD-dependent epimerase/dehydratase family protein [Bryobacteraceae bacterium]|nr:NAD-dependent epimerase/dehydratase family protein [Bryobacteraceae bacterium]
MTGPLLITGGAGFIGTNLADRLLSEGQRVLLFDNLSRGGVERNLQWLQDRHGPLLDFELGDVRDADAVRACVRRASAVFHFASQVAVTTSLVDPITDFEINARGTLNILEELRWSGSPAPLFFTSTNKVYGDLDDIPLRRAETRYVPTEPGILKRGVSEERCLCFHSPYGCSKGTADQYVLDYARSFGIRSTVFRMSCIYGPHQFGTEDQGWVAHFLMRALERAAVTLFGDGRQVRDILFVTDLVDAFLFAWHNTNAVAGRVFNIGGGPGNTISLLELLATIRTITGETPQIEYESWRVGDQRYYVSDTSRFTAATGWRPKVAVEEGVRALHDWLATSRERARLAAPVLFGGAA